MTPASRVVVGECPPPIFESTAANDRIHANALLPAQTPLNPISNAQANIRVAAAGCQDAAAALPVSQRRRRTSSTQPCYTESEEVIHHSETYFHTGTDRKAGHHGSDWYASAFDDDGHFHTNNDEGLGGGDAIVGASGKLPASSLSIMPANTTSNLIFECAHTVKQGKTSKENWHALVGKGMRWHALVGKKTRLDDVVELMEGDLRDHLQDKRLEWFRGRFVHGKKHGKGLEIEYSSGRQVTFEGYWSEDEEVFTEPWTINYQATRAKCKQRYIGFINDEYQAHGQGRLLHFDADGNETKVEEGFWRYVLL